MERVLPASEGSPTRASVEEQQCATFLTLTASDIPTGLNRIYVCLSVHNFNDITDKYMCIVCLLQCSFSPEYPSWYINNHYNVAVATDSSGLGMKSLPSLYASMASCFSPSLGFSRITHLPRSLSYARTVTTAE